MSLVKFCKLEGQACSGEVTPLVPRGPGFDAASLHYIAGVKLASYNPSPDPTLCGSFQHWVCPLVDLYSFRAMVTCSYAFQVRYS
jgi:hypothetical protein